MNAAGLLSDMYENDQYMFSKKKRMKLDEDIRFSPPQGFSIEDMTELFRGIIKRLQPLIDLPKRSLLRAVSIDEKIEHLKHKVSSRMKVSFYGFLASAKNRQEAVVSFLALLELIKQRIVIYEQPDIFQDIIIKSNR